jgi:hypothetical protein
MRGKAMTHELLNAVAALLHAVAWPFVFILVALVFRKPITELLRNLKSVSAVGITLATQLAEKVEKESEALEGEVEALRGAHPKDEDAAKKVTEKQVEAAVRVERLVRRTDPLAAKEEMRSLALEYDWLREVLPSGDARSRRLDSLVLKMRTLALACRPFLREFVESSSPGERLAAVAILQVAPDPAYVEWLVRRLTFNEQNYFVYQAAVALLQVVPRVEASKRPALAQVVRQVQETVPPTSWRWRKLDEVQKELSKPPAEEQESELD